jgi:Zn-dependent protease
MADTSLLQGLIVLIILVASAIVHEVAHGLTAEYLGDPTARSRGRITLNPIAHIDLFMTILLPLSLVLVGSPIVFGGAKPVPVDPRYFINPRHGMGIVAIAGPISNFVIAAGCLAVIYALVALSAESHTVVSLVIGLLTIGYMVNLVLALFNLLPVPPLDGGRIAVAVLPLPAARLVARIEPFGLFIVAALLLSGVVGAYLGPSLELALTLLPIELGGR